MKILEKVQVKHQYSVVQALYWMTSCALAGYAAVYLQDRGLSNTLIGVTVGGRCLSVHGDSTSGSSDCGEYFWSDRKESDSGSDCYDGGYVWGINRVSCTGGRSSDLVYGDEYAELLYAAHAERYGNGVY